jgi:8-oxo-dGTP diphosphatase
LIKVTCALIINHEGKILAAQRSSAMSLPLKWEFPGGKIEPSETAEQCLVREIKEELDIAVEIIKALPANRHIYPTITIELIPFICRYTEGEIILKEHAQYQWLPANELLTLDWADADVPIVENYLTLFSI